MEVDSSKNIDQLLQDNESLARELEQTHEAKDCIEKLLKEALQGKNDLSLEFEKVTSELKESEI
mgnify:FL=1